MTTEALLSRLQAVHKRGPGQWSARCPAHDDKGPSLSVKELPDGRTLVHCFAACGTDEVLQAVGLDMTELFPPRTEPGSGTAALKRRRMLSDRQALDLLHAEVQLVGIVAADVGRGETVSPEDCRRVLRAAGRIAVVRQELYS